MKTNAQVALEFMLFTVLGVFIIVSGIVLAAHLTLGVLDERGIDDAEELISVLQEEIILAAQVHDGYHHIVNVPLTLGKGDYDLNTSSSFISITKNGVTFTKKIPVVNGSFKKGSNVVVYENNQIFIQN